MDWQLLFEVLRLENYNTRLVVFSTALLGMASGVIGSFLLLRKRSLMGDVLSHATLPGVGIAFAVLVALGFTGKELGGLWLGATIFGVLGVLAVNGIKKHSLLPEDAAMGIVLSVFFGAGIVVLSVVQRMPGANAAGLESFLYGKTASLVWNDFIMISVAAFVSQGVVFLFFKELKILCFDEHFTDSLGFSPKTLEVILLSLVVLVIVAGLQSVGLILVIALLVIPAAAARFWTNDLKKMIVFSACFGVASGWFGGIASALFSDLPAGAVIVLCAAALFLFSMFFAPARGIIPREFKRLELIRKVDCQHLLRAVYELLENKQNLKNEIIQNLQIDFSSLLKKRSWSPKKLQSIIRKEKAFIQNFDGGHLQLSESGFAKAARITRNHRLWELYLVKYADIAPSHVDRDADMIEHILDAELVARLENELNKLKLGHVGSLHKVK